MKLLRLLTDLKYLLLIIAITLFIMELYPYAVCCLFGTLVAWVIDEFS